jgi:hypothetical protein
MDRAPTVRLAGRTTTMVAVLSAPGTPRSLRGQGANRRVGTSEALWTATRGSFVLGAGASDGGETLALALIETLY